VPIPGGHECPQDRAVDTTLHDAAFIADQFDPISVGARDHSAAAVHVDGSFVGDDREQISERFHAIQGIASANLCHTALSGDIG